MTSLLLRIALRALLCAAMTWWMYTKLGLVAVPIAAPLFGAALARPLIDLLEAMHQSGKEHILREAQGRYWAHRGTRVDIAEDDDDARWLLLTDVRKIVPGLPRDEVMRKQYADRVAVLEPAPGLRIRADALADYLQKSTDTSSLKFKTWLDHEVMGGSKNPRTNRQSNASV
jgi:hypothetical protein